MPTHTDGEYEMPSAEAMLAGTLALMTGHAQSACQRQQSLMAQKIVSNLLCIAAHPSFSAHFKAVAERMRPHWTVLSQASGNLANLAPTTQITPVSQPTPGGPQPLWHAAAPRLQ